MLHRVFNPRDAFSRCLMSHFVPRVRVQFLFCRRHLVSREVTPCCHSKQPKKHMVSIASCTPCDANRYCGNGSPHMLALSWRYSKVGPHWSLIYQRPFFSHAMHHVVRWSLIDPYRVGRRGSPCPNRPLLPTLLENVNGAQRGSGRHLAATPW